MINREYQLNKLLKEEFGDKCLYKNDKNGDMYAIQMGLYGSYIIVDVLTNYSKVQILANNAIKIDEASQNLPNNTPEAGLNVGQGLQITQINNAKDEMPMNSARYEPPIQKIKTALPFGETAPQILSINVDHSNI